MTETRENIAAIIDIFTNRTVAPERLKRIKRNPEREITLGARIRAARIAAGMSQSALGAAVGISFQQLQKYELGKDRVAVSTLQGIAAALGVHPGAFFNEDIQVPVRPIPEVKAAFRVADVFAQIGDTRVRKRLIDLAKVLGGTDDEQVKPPTIAADEPR